MPFEFERQKIKDVILIKPKVFGDNRGFFMETYKRSDFVANGIVEEFNQDNHSKSGAKVLRGLHYQAKPYGQAKIVRCVRGRIFDVAVDIRPKSETFAQYCYKASGEYNPEADRGILWSDNQINIDWGIDFEPILSQKDSTQPLLKEI